MPEIWYTNERTNMAVAAAMEEGTKFPARFVLDLPKNKAEYPGPSIVYGILRGCSEIIRLCEAKGYDYWHIDHGYMGRGEYYRISRNGLQAPVPAFDDYPRDRLGKLDIHLKEWRDGETILLCPPTPYIVAHYRLGDWVKMVREELRGWTNRKIVVREKTSRVPLQDDLDSAHCVIVYNSNVGLEAMMQGIPAIATGPTPWGGACRSWFGRGMPDIERLKRPDRERILAYLSYCQFSLSEMKSGYAWEMVEKYQ